MLLSIIALGKDSKAWHFSILTFLSLDGKLSCNFFSTSFSSIETSLGQL